MVTGEILMSRTIKRDKKVLKKKNEYSNGAKRKNKISSYTDINHKNRKTYHLHTVVNYKMRFLNTFNFYIIF